MVRPAIFFDRDGVLNRLIERDGGFYSPRTIENFLVCEDIPEIFRLLTDHGLLIVVVTNQPDIGRGHLTSATLAKMTLQLSQLGATAVYVCPHDSDAGCTCRKPLPGLLTRAIKELEIDPDKSVLVGDRRSDIEAATGAGVSGYLLSPRTTRTKISWPSDLLSVLRERIYERTGIQLG